MRALYLLWVALAGTAAVTATAEERTRELEEVRVTAQLREESAQSIPLSLVSFGEQQLDVLGIDNLGDLEALVPNLSLDRFPANNQTLRLFIRGVGLTDVQITQDPAVGVYLDGVYIARSTGLALDVPDLERVEVLRGPQGTLYGRNTTGGAINMVTRRPDTSGVSFRQDLGSGNRDLWRSRTSLNLPLGDRVGVKFAYLVQGQDGFIDNAGPGGGFGDRQSDGSRIDLFAQLTEPVTLDYAWDRSRIEYHNYTPQAVYPAPPRGGLIDLIGASARRFVPYAEERLGTLATSVSLLPNDIDIEGHTLRLQWQRGAHTLRAISGWRTLEERSYIDFASGASIEYRVDFNAATLAPLSADPIELPAVRPRLDHQQFSQELQWLAAPGPRLDVVSGLYYFREDAEEFNSPPHFVFGAPLGRELYPYVVNVREELNDIDNSAYAAYAQFTWTPPVVRDRLHLGFGARYSRDRRKVERDVSERTLLDSGNSAGDLLPGVIFESEGDRTFKDVSVSFTAEYDWRDNLHAFGKYMQAYRSGGYNVRDPDPAFFALGFDEEKIHSLEGGFKGELLQGSLRVNATAFVSRIEDYQLNFQIPGTISGTRVFNTGRANLSGLELELTMIPAYDLLLSLNYAYLDATIDPATNPLTGEIERFTFSNAPRNTVSFMLDYSLPPVDYGRWGLNVGYHYTADRQRHNPDIIRPAYSLFNARFGLYELRALGGQLDVSAWAKNLMDEDYTAFALDNLPHAGRAVLWGETRTLGVDLTYRYN